MHVFHATGRASVDLFLRNLQFSFAPYDVLGVPGGLIGLEEPVEDERCAMLVHELEHYAQLSYPLGSLFSALAIQARELQARLHQAVQEVQNNDAAGQPITELEEERAHAVIESAKAAESFLRLIRAIQELMLPLLEGLAVISEMEQVPFSSPSHAFMIPIEFLHARYLLYGSSPKVSALFDSNEEFRQEFIHTLMDRFGDQMEASRGRLRRSSVFDHMFMGPPDFEDPEQAGLSRGMSPYFWGYLYLRRLFQDWEHKAPDIPPQAFFGFATRLVCYIMPATLLPFINLGVHPELFMDFCDRVYKMLGDFLDLPAEQVERLWADRRLLCWDFEKREFNLPPELTYIQDESAELQEAAAALSPQTYFENAIAWYVFDADESRMDAIKETLSEVEAAKRLILVSDMAVRVVAVDEEEQKLVIVSDAEPKLVPTVEISAEHPDQGYVVSSGTQREQVPFFLRDAPKFRECLADVEATCPLERISLFHSPFNWTGQAYLSARLCVYLFDSPYSVGQDVMPAAIVRALHFTTGDRTSIYVEVPSQVDPANVQALLQKRADINGQLLPFLETVLSTDAPTTRPHLERLAEQHAHNPILHEELKELLEMPWWQRRPDFGNLRDGVYGSLLFLPSLSFPHLAVAKLDALDNSKTVRKWLRRGAALIPERRSALSEEELPAVESVVKSVRTQAQMLLGVPIVALQRDPPAIVLDLIPPTMQQKVEDAVEQFAWMVVNSHDDELWFSYTVGLYRSFQHPEIIITGLSHDIAHPLLNIMGGQVREGARFADGEESASIVQDYRCIFRTVEPKYYQQHFSYALQYYGEATFPALQCVWPDKSQLYPWETGCDPAVVEAQLLLFNPLTT